MTSYSDIGKAAKDLLSKDFPVGSTKLELNSTTVNGLVTASGEKDNKSGSILAELKAKYSCKERGLTLTKTIKTSNCVSSQVEWSDVLTKGLKLDVDFSLKDKGEKNVKLGSEFKHRCAVVKSTLDLYKGPLVNFDFATAKNGFIVGGDISFDVASNKLVGWGYAGGYVADSYALTLKGLKKCAAWEASFYHTVNPDTEIVVKAAASCKALSEISIEAGAKYKLDSDSFVKVKTDSLGNLGLGYSHVLRPGVKIGLGGLFDTTRLQDNVHKLGFSLVFEA